MKLVSRQFGEVDYVEENILHFSAGLIGFETFQRYLLINSDEEIFYWLVSVDEPEIVFPIFPVKLLQSEYPAVENSEEFAIVRLAKEPSDITVNLKAPLYVNMQEKKGFQKILDSDIFPIDYKLFIQEEG
ncbi:Flagellar assembly factor FliW [Anaerolineae bacterium]|nr:Flagellar assembly factor FliW [Anaerolineae bacterium]